MILDPFWPILRVLYTRKLDRLIGPQWKIKFILQFFSSAYVYNIYSGKLNKRHKYTSNVTNVVIHVMPGLPYLGIVIEKSQ